MRRAEIFSTADPGSGVTSVERTSRAAGAAQQAAEAAAPERAGLKIRQASSGWAAPQIYGRPQGSRSRPQPGDPGRGKKEQAEFQTAVCTPWKPPGEQELAVLSRSSAANGTGRTKYRPLEQAQGLPKKLAKGAIRRGLRDRRNIRRQRSIRLHNLRKRSHDLVRLPRFHARTKRREQVDPLARGEQFDR